MIAHIKGIISFKDTKEVIVDVNGIGYSVEVPPQTVNELPSEGESITFYTYYYQNRENEIKLYGFTSRDALKIFKMALTVKGVGPTLAQNIVTRLSPSQFQKAVHSEDAITLTRVPRLNKELAQLIIIKLKKNIATVKLEAEGKTDNMLSTDRSVIDILVGWGASELEAEQAVGKARELLGDTAARENLVKQAFRYIGNQTE